MKHRDIVLDRYIVYWICILLICIIKTNRHRRHRDQPHTRMFSGERRERAGLPAEGYRFRYMFADIALPNYSSKLYIYSPCCCCIKIGIEIIIIIVFVFFSLLS